MSSKQDRAEVSCPILVDMLLLSEDEDMRRLMVNDIAWKSRSIVSSNTRSQIAGDTAMAFSPKYVRTAFQPKENRMERLRYKDVLIVTLMESELFPSMIALGINPEQEPKISNGIRFWEQTLETSGSRPPLDIVLAVLGVKGNSDCAAACSTVFRNYQAGLCVLVGVAAGLQGKVNLGDVISADLVIDYERARVTPDGLKRRPVPFPLENDIGRTLEIFNPLRHNWGPLFRERFNELKISSPGVKMEDVSDEWVPKFDTAVILSGEKKIEDASLGEYRELYHDRVRAAEMEGAGFARICKENATPWLVFRGISDFGNPEITKNWQPVAALSAAFALATFLKHTYRLPTDPEF